MHGTGRKFFSVGNPHLVLLGHAEGHGWSSRVVVVSAADPGGSE